MNLKVTLTVNGEPCYVEAPADTPLLWILRAHLSLTGTKFGCGIGLCGACTVHLDGVPTRSCLVALEAAVSKTITTIEGIQGREIEALRSAWRNLNVVQCGYCQSGQLMSACALLRGTHEPSDAQIDSAMDGNLCRCGTYPRIRSAIHRAAGELMKLEND
jgi:isoquinoline 1-oxidoreductase subunit alpha